MWLNRHKWYRYNKYLQFWKSICLIILLYVTFHLGLWFVTAVEFTSWKFRFLGKMFINFVDAAGPKINFKLFFVYVLQRFCPRRLVQSMWSLHWTLTWNPGFFHRSHPRSRPFPPRKHSTPKYRPYLLHRHSNPDPCLVWHSSRRLKSDGSTTAPRRYFLILVEVLAHLEDSARIRQIYFRIYLA